MKRCSICKTPISDSDVTFNCAECKTPFHQVCWEKLGGCATYGCKAAAIPEKPDTPTSVSRGWGDEKTCPGCKASIPATLIICGCGARFPWADPMTAEEYETWLKEDGQRSSVRKQLVWLFVISLLGVPAPITGVLAGIQAHRFRHVLVGEVGTYLALGYGAAAIGIVYTVVFVLLTLGW